MPNLLPIFLTGLLTGGLTCMAVQGSLLTTLIASQEKEAGGLEGLDGLRRMRLVSISTFLIFKILAYTILGFLLGWLGSFFQLTLTMQVALLLLVALFMIGSALNMLNVHPWFRYFVIQPPKFLTRLVRQQSKSTSLFAPATLGAFTVFIPCGTTQAMMVLAVSARNPLYGALTMLAFTLGTSPVFFALGYSVTKLKDMLQDRFAKVAATVVLGLALWNINSAVVLAGSPWTFQSAASSIYCTVTFCRPAEFSNVLSGQAPTQEATVTFARAGYSVDHRVIKAGAPVTLHLKNTDGAGCVQAFTIPSLGVQKVVPVGTSTDITFTAPTKTGTLAFMCSMGMYRGEFEVVEG